MERMMKQKMKKELNIQMMMNNFRFNVPIIFYCLYSSFNTALFTFQDSKVTCYIPKYGIYSARGGTLCNNIFKLV